MQGNTKYYRFAYRDINNDDTVILWEGDDLHEGLDAGRLLGGMLMRSADEAVWGSWNGFGGFEGDKPLRAARTTWEATVEVLWASKEDDRGPRWSREKTFRAATKAEALTQAMDLAQATIMAQDENPIIEKGWADEPDVAWHKLLPVGVRVIVGAETWVRWDEKIMFRGASPDPEITDHGGYLSKRVVREWAREWTRKSANSTEFWLRNYARPMGPWEERGADNA